MTEPNRNTIKIQLTVRVEAHVKCLTCSRTMTRHSFVVDPDAALERAVDPESMLGVEVLGQLRGMKSSMQAEMDRRGWTDQLCGVCRDRDIPPLVS